MKNGELAKSLESAHQIEKPSENWVFLSAKLKVEITIS
jgi:hypothetical protein